MAIQWGGTSGHMQVGIDVRTSGYDWTTTAVTVYVDFYVRTIAWGANDNQHLDGYVNGGLWGAWDYTMVSGSGATTEKFVGTVAIGGQGLSYGGGPNYTFQGNVSGSALGPNPSHAINWSLPARPPGPPTLPGVSISNVSATDALLNVSASADARGSTIHTYNQEIRRVSDGALHRSWNGGTGWASGSGSPLQPNTAYYGRSQAINYVGSSGWATTANFTTANIVPNAPQSFAHGLEGPSDVPLTWAAPVGNGGTAVTGYTIQAAPPGVALGAAGTLTKTVGNVLAATFDGLTPGLEYSFRVRAKNAQGDGAWSTTITATTLATNTVRVPGVGYVPVRAWGKIPGLGWRTLTVWKRPAGSGGVYRT